MTEPHASEFQRLVRSGAGTRDIHAAIGVGYAQRAPASDRFVEREMERVDLHRHASCALLEAFAGRAPRVLDVGCSTGGSTVALALSDVLAPEATIGVDPDALSLRAAEVRARGHGLDPRRVSFVRNEPDRPLPFASRTFDLVVCISVLEFVPEADARRRLVEEMKRVVRPGGLIYVSTPNPLRLREAHSRRWLGDLVRRNGYPWASPPWAVRAMVADCERVPVERWTIAHALGLPQNVLPRPIATALDWARPWQKVLVRKPR